MRAASRASDDSCSYSFDTRCTQSGNASTGAFLRPMSGRDERKKKHKTKEEGKQISAITPLLEVLRLCTEDADLGIRHTAVEAALRVRLVLAVAVATRRPATHLGWICTTGTKKRKKERKHTRKKTVAESEEK